MRDLLSKFGMKFLAITALLASTFILFSPVIHFDYINFDDPDHIIEQPQIQSGKLRSLSDAFLKENNVNNTYLPFTICSFYLEKKIFGLSSASSHLINLILHLLVVLLVFQFSREMGLSFTASYAAAAIFALHPMHADPVAWATGRKDLLYALFYLSSLIFYCRYQQTFRSDLYILSFVMAVGSILSKPMALSLPLILLLIDYVQFKSAGRRRILEKIPFFVAVSLIAGISYLMNSRPVPIEFPGSFLIWGWHAFFYIQAFFWPVALSSLYGVPLPVSISNPAYWCACLGLLVIVPGFLVKKTGARWYAFAIIFYVLSTFFLWRFDRFDILTVDVRYMYLPSLGLCIFLGYIIEQALMRSVRYAIAVLSLIFVFSCILSIRQELYWKNSWTFWSHVIDTRPDLYFAHYMRADAVLSERFYSGLSSDFEKYVYRRLPSQPQGFKQQNLVRTKLHFFRFLYAIRCFRYGLSKGLWHRDEFQQIPSEMTFMNKGLAFYLIGDYKHSLHFFILANSTGKPKWFKCFMLGKNYSALGEYATSIKYFNEALVLQQNNYDVLLARGAQYALIGNMNAAFADALQLYTIDPQAKGAYDLLFNVLLALGRLDDAWAVLDKELSLWPHESQVYWHQGVFADRHGDKKAAAKYFCAAKESGYKF
ncbi:MAG: glycosyltransferase family 39 protein [Candidatus Omnitrophica bacterium]|nr:glycosyltransferase family 39 protein [Candidatus Omnitrophota bacterium]